MLRFESLLSFCNKTCLKFTLYFETGSILSIFLSGFFWLRLIVISSADSECEAYASAFISEIETPYWASYGFFLAHHYARVELNATDSTIDTMYSAIKYEGRSMFRFVFIKQIISLICFCFSAITPINLYTIQKISTTCTRKPVEYV